MTTNPTYAIIKKSESGTAPITKNGIHGILTFNSKGATPIEKNVIVVDSQGNEYEATYPKRAKGLVKSGRARFVGDNKICLACPPSDNLEDKIMENNTKVEAAATVQDELGFTTKDIFEQIKALQNELAEKHSLFRLDDALLAVFANTEFEDDQAKSDAVSNITAVFASREESLRYLLSMYKELLNIIIFNLK